MKPSPNLCEFGKPNIACDEDIQPNDVDEKILDDDFIDKCIECTNEHGQSVQFM